MCRFFSLRHSEQTLFHLLYTFELLLRLSLFNIYLLPLMSFQSAAPSHFWYHCPYPFLSIHLCPPRSPWLQSTTTTAHSVYFEFNCAYFLQRPSFSPLLSRGHPIHPAARLPHLQWSFATTSEPTLAGWGPRPPARRPARPGGPNAAVMRLAASFSNFDDVVSPLPTVRGASQFPAGKRASSRRIFSGKGTFRKAGAYSNLHTHTHTKQCSSA